MLKALRKWFNVGGPLYSHPGWSGHRGNFAPSGKGQPPTAEELSTIAAVNRSCTLFSDSTASQKWSVTQARPSGGVFNVTGTDAGHAINEWSYEGREMWLFSAALLGNAYSVIHRNERGGAMELETVAPWRVSLEWTDSKNLVYRIAEDESMQQPERLIAANDMLHLKFRTTGRHPLLGVSPLTQLAPALAPYLLIRDGISEVFDWITLPGSYFATDEKLNVEQINQIKDAIQERDNGKPVVLGGNMQMKEVPLPNLGSLQSLEMSQYGIQEIGRAWGIPPSLLGQTENINYSSAAEMSRSFTTISLQPFASRVESCLSHALLTRTERMSGRGINIDLLNMTLGFGQERADFLAKLTNSGIMSVNESREISGLANVEGGDELRSPLNQQPTSQWVAEPEPEPVVVPIKQTPRIVKMLESV